MAKRKDSSNELVEAEKQAMRESEAGLSDSISTQDIDEAVIEGPETERGADADAALPAEAAAVHTDTETAEEASGKIARAAKPKRSTKEQKTKRVKRRSARYAKALGDADVRTPLKLIDALERVKATSYSRFDGTVELHVRLTLKKGSASESIRGLVTLPGGAPKAVKAVLLTEALIDEIALSKRAEADLYLATPALMAKVAKVAKILGPQGKMPNPKTGTVTTDPDAVLAEIQSGRIEYRADSYGIVHVGIGKVSWPIERLASNVETIIASIGANRLRSVYLAATMGPSITVDLTTLSA